MSIRGKYFLIQSPNTSILHQAKGTNSHGAVIMVAGAGGGLTGPSAVYEELVETLSGSGITAIIVDYRRPNALQDCVEDVMATVKILKDSFEVEKLGIIGWSFGRAVAMQSCFRSSDIIGAATVASQTYGATEPAQRLGNKRSLLLIHDTGDICLSHACSRQLF
jgi:alpha/beta superfamily hydrolase